VHTITLTSMPSTPKQPGLAKVRNAPLVRTRHVRLLSTLDGRWRDVLEAADIMSEGTVRQEGDRIVYYGSTSLLIRPRAAGGELPDDELEQVAALLRLDPHVRLRALRVAHREASVRAGSAIGGLSAELVITVSGQGVVVTIDVVARVQGRRGTAGGRAR
jgi:hypothetical protein